MAGINEDGMNRCFGYPEPAKTNGSNIWYLGADVECERLDKTTSPTNALATWDDGPYTFVLRKRKTTDANDHALPEAQLAYPKRARRSTYLIGEAAFCRAESKFDKIKAREYEMVAQVKRLEPQIPVPEIIYWWQDDQRFWQISRRVPGETLQAAWIGLTDTEREAIADAVAQHVHALAKHTSPTIQSGLGNPMQVPYLEMPSGIMGAEEAKAHFDPIPDSEGPYILSHGELTTMNVIVNNGRLAGIIDWETLRYEPRWWTVTAPVATLLYSFDPELYQTDRENNAWGSLLSKKLTDLGPVHHELWVKWAWSKIAEQEAMSNDGNTD